MFQDLSIPALHACVTRRWSAQIGDPTAAGWITLAAYGVCALLAILIVLRQSEGRVRVFWATAMVAMLVLGVNKQLDLQSVLTALGRCISQEQGWYGERRDVQRHFIEGLIAAIGVILVVMLWLMRRHLRQNALALLGLAMVAAFVAVRAVGFHHVDVLINRRLLDVRLNVVFELAGLALIAVNALALLRHRKGAREPGAR